MKVLVTVPFNSRVPILAEWLDMVLKWTYESSHNVTLWPERTPNRMDWSISACIQQAKDTNPEWWVRLDADSAPIVPLDKCLEYAVENRRAGFDVTGVATIMSDGVVQAKFLEPGEPGSVIPAAAMEVEWVSGSLVFTPRAVFQRMERVGEYVFRDGSTKWFYIQPQHPGATEDVDFCERIRALGFRVCADTRIQCGQDRPHTRMPSLTPGMTWGGQVTVHLQGAEQA